MEFGSLYALLHNETVPVSQELVQASAYARHAHK